MAANSSYGIQTDRQKHRHNPTRGHIHKRRSWQGRCDRFSGAALRLRLLYISALDLHHRSPSPLSPVVGRRFMPAGTTTAESYIYSSLFGYARPTQTSLASASIRIHSAQDEQSGQKALGATLMQDLVGVGEKDDADEDMEVPVTMSTSCFADPISSSPAAMFLSAFSSPKSSVPQPDSEGHVVSGYTLGPIIGHGAFSTIRRAFSASGDVVAVKIIRRSDHFKRGSDSALAKRLIKHEAEVWATLSHEHILPLFSAAHTPYADYFFTLFCPAGSLYDILKRDGRPELPHDDVGTMFRQVVRGLRYLHEVAMLVHRDIKLENVLVDESGVCRIGDFGMTKRIGELDEEEEEEQDQQQTEVYRPCHATVHRAVSLNVPNPRVGIKGTSLQAQLARHRNSTSSSHPTPPPKFQPGSLPYAAPELLLPQASPIILNPAQDIWALGVVLHTLLTGHLPFYDSFEPRLQMKILNGVYEVPSGIGRGAERVLKGCLDRSDATRWNIAMVDEVAWGVGRGPESDDIAPTDSDEEFQVLSHSRSRSRRRLGDAIPEDPEWHQEELSSHPAHEAASRRSSSRMRRSLSRAPHSRPTLTRSTSRPRRASSPSVTTFNATGTPARSPSVARSPSSIRSPSSTRSSHFSDPILDLPSASSFERGRRRQKFLSADHSPSPSIAPPMTPSDSLGPDPHLDRSSSCGPRKVESNTALPPLRGAEHLYVAEEFETLEVSQSTTFTHRSGRAQVPDMFVGRRVQRSQSKPPYEPTFAYSASRRGGKCTPSNEEAWPRPLLSGDGDSKGLFNFPTTLLRPVKPTTAVNRRTRSRSLEILR